VTDSRPAPPRRGTPPPGPDAAIRRESGIERWSDRIIRAVLWAIMRLPYRLRIPLAGWVVARLVAPIAGYSNRIRKNLALVCPELAGTERRRLVRGVSDNVGRCLAELWSGAEFNAQMRGMPVTGPGAEAIAAAHRDGRPVILATGHFGNYNASRAVMLAHGYPVGALYKPMTNAAFNDHYVAAMSAIGTPLFARGRQGMGEMIRFLREGGMLGMLFDLHVGDGAELTFFGHRAKTATTAADLAIKYGAELVPIYGIRAPDGLSFEIRAEAPVPHGDPLAMMQSLNDGLETLVRRHMDQWFWIHRRWK
jgi:KDO2-lipid IV(A) lauroyltransferase